MLLLHLPIFRLVSMKYRLIYPLPAATGYCCLRVTNGQTVERTEDQTNEPTNARTQAQTSERMDEN